MLKEEEALNLIDNDTKYTIEKISCRFRNHKKEVKVWVKWKGFKERTKEDFYSLNIIDFKKKKYINMNINHHYQMNLDQHYE